MESGSRLLHYRLLEKLGEGGMGVVWRAHDTRLDREVAVKVLPESLAADAERLARFDREARTLATLQHPNVASIYGFEEYEEFRFLVMELAEGEDLSVRMSRGTLSVEETVELAGQGSPMCRILMEPSTHSFSRRPAADDGRRQVRDG